MGDVMALLRGLSNRTPRLARGTPEQRPFHYWIHKWDIVDIFDIFDMLCKLEFIIHHTGLMP